MSQRIDPLWTHKPRRLPRDDGRMRTNADQEKKLSSKTSPKG